jgi:hypothetical protein
LPLTKSAKLIEKAALAKREEKAYRWWLARVPMYDKDNYETFEQFYEKLYPPTVTYDMRSKDELMDEILGRE